MITSNLKKAKSILTSGKVRSNSGLFTVDQMVQECWKNKIGIIQMLVAVPDYIVPEIVENGGKVAQGVKTGFKKYLDDYDYDTIQKDKNIPGNYKESGFIDMDEEISYFAGKIKETKKETFFGDMGYKEVYISGRPLYITWHKKYYGAGVSYNKEAYFAMAKDFISSIV